MEKKTAVYICTGCDIGDSIDIEALSNVATSEYKAPICKNHPNLCGKEGVALIDDDIEKEGVNTVVIAACSPRERADLFIYDPTKISLERVNLREHVAWCHTPKDEDTQMLAEDYMRMGMTKAGKMLLLEPFIEEIDKKVMVVGGGITGLTSALSVADAGYEAILVEKEAELGGFMSKIWKKYPTTSPYAELQDTGIDELIEKVKSHSNVKVHTGTKIEKTAGSPGMYDVSLVSGESFRVGSIVEATGWQPYDASKLDHLGYGKSKNVVTQIDVETMAKEGKFERPSDGKKVSSVAFIQCAGSRDKDHLVYCSSHCCLNSLKQAKYFRENNKDTKVYILYKDMRTPGQGEIFYKNAQEDDGIFLTKGDVTGVSVGSGDGLLVDLDNTLLGESIQIEADMVVLATGMVPTAGIQVKDLAPVEEKSEDCKEEEGGEEDAVLADQIIPSDILNLDYRQGPEAPALRYGFPDSHYICFPYESRRTGIYMAGCVRHPLDGALSADDGAGAALKAIQCVELASAGSAVHPRVGDMSYPELYMSRCTQCKRCTEECPFGMYNEDEKGNPLPNPTRCRRCGICMGSCPERIISFKDYSVDIVGSMIKSIEIPEEDEEKPRVIAFLCENDAYPAMDVAARKRMIYNPWVRVISLRCLGNINLQWVADSLSKGIDGVLLIGCKHGDDYQCHYVKGSELAEVRMSKIKETLDRLVLESERVRVLQLSIDEYDQLPGIFDDFLEDIDAVGPNPYKDF